MEVTWHVVAVSGLGVAVLWLAVPVRWPGMSGDSDDSTADFQGVPVIWLSVPVTSVAVFVDIHRQPCDKEGVALGALLSRVQGTLRLNQKELADLIGCSARTVIRYYKRGGHLAPVSYERLARACHPQDPALAAELATLAGKTLASLGLEPPAVLLPSPTSTVSPRYLADSIVCAAAEAMQAPPNAMRPALLAGLERAAALKMSVEDVLQALRPPRPAKPKGG